VSRIAHATASALITRVRDEPTDAVVERLITFTDAHGLETVAELWSHSPAKSLPGTLWRLYLLQLMVRDDAATAALLYERGRTVLHSVDDVVAGAPTPAGPEELITLVDEILRGVFTGDFAVALERAASFCRVEAAGAADLADDYDDTEPNRASTFTTRALRLDTYAGDLCGVRRAVAARRADLTGRAASRGVGRGRFDCCARSTTGSLSRIFGR
jgi:hypothetical protein